MMQVRVEFVGERTKEVTIELPTKCPHCGEKMTPMIHGRGYSRNKLTSLQYTYGLLVSCIQKNCNKFFSVQYDIENKLIPYDYRPPINVDLPENIEKISQSFVEIYSQSVKAEEEGLNQISGVGYRKSLEFLIKDYVIFLNPEQKESIEKEFLGIVIKNHLTHLPRLQSLAKAASWIGNDETHYVRRHNDKDLRDMKQFIKSTAHFVVADYDAYLAEKFISQDDE